MNFKKTTAGCPKQPAVVISSEARNLLTRQTAKVVCLRNILIDNYL